VLENAWFYDVIKLQLHRSVVGSLLAQLEFCASVDTCGKLQ
jgi:hypothetical protein